MPLRLSTAEIETALPGLSPDERAELHGLLERRDRMAAEVPHDSREPIEEIVKRMHAETAAASVNPEAWVAAHEAHRRSYDAHYARLSQARTGHPCDDIEAFLREVSEGMKEAEALARADGFRPADEVVPPRGRSASPVDSVSTASLPPAVREDIAYTRAVSRRAVAAPLPPAPFVAPIVDVLAPYRGTGLSDDMQQAEDR